MYAAHNNSFAFVLLLKTCVLCGKGVSPGNDTIMGNSPASDNFKATSTHRNACSSHVKCLLVLYNKENWNVSRNFSKTSQCLISLKSIQQCSCGQRHRMKLTGTYLQLHCEHA